MPTLKQCRSIYFLKQVEIMPKKKKNKTKICPLSYLATSAGRSVIQDARLQTVFSMWLANTTNDAFKRGEE